MVPDPFRPEGWLTCCGCEHEMNTSPKLELAIDEPHAEHRSACGQLVAMLNSSKAGYHVHPWPSAVRIVSGSYAMSFGYQHSDREENLGRLILGRPSLYEITHPRGMHSVAPTTRLVYSLMVTGTHWPRDLKEHQKPYSGPLPDLRKKHILAQFEGFYRAGIYS
jgi:hypothetical protein